MLSNFVHAMNYATATPSRQVIQVVWMHL